MTAFFSSAATPTSCARSSRTSRCARAREQKVASAVADLDDFSQHEALFAGAQTALGGLDVVLIAHGSLPDQKDCEASVERAMAEISHQCAERRLDRHAGGEPVRAAGRGTIAVIGSVAGDRGRQSNYVYGAAKGMVAVFLQGLRNRLARSGVAVVTIKPGFVDTPMTANIARKGLLWAQPDAVARGIVGAVARGRDVVYLPSFWRLIMLAIVHIPERVFKRMSL